MLAPVNTNTTWFLRDGLSEIITSYRVFKMKNIKNKFGLFALAIVTSSFCITNVSAQVPNDPQYSEQWSLNNTGQNGGTTGADIDVEGAWDIETGNQTVVVAVIDSGIDINHPDLYGNIWVNSDEIPGNGIDDDGNGYIDDVHGWDFVGNDNDIDPGPTSSGDDAREFHGTHVAGIVGAVGNDGIGMSGIAWNVQLMGVRFFARADDPQEALIDRAVAAIRYAVDNDADIINASFGYDFKYSFFLPAEVTAALDYAEENGVLVVCAAGNDAMNIDNTVFAPGGLSNDNILTVASTDQYDQFISAFNYGPTKVDVAAPGYSIYSTMPYGNYAYLSGTSMSTPHVAGIAALLKAQDPSRTAIEIKQIIMDTVDPLPSLQGKIVTGGRVNAASALNFDRGIPEITLLGEEVVTIEIDSTYIDMGATAFDKQDGDISHLIEVSGDTVDTSVIGTYVINYDVVDSDGLSAPTISRTVNVVEEQTCIEYSVSVSEHESNDRAYHRTTGYWIWQTTTWYAEGSDDNLGTDDSAVKTLHQIPGNSDWNLGSCPGPDVTPPVLTLHGNNPMQVTLGSVFTDPGASAEDNLDGDISSAIIVTGNVNTAVLGQYELTYYVEDQAGNSAEETRTVEVVEGSQCITAVNSVHISEGRAYEMYGILVYAQGSRVYLGLKSATTSLEESSPGNWVKCD